jgi:hypothetical protein
MRQDRRPGRIGEPIEKGDEVLGGAECGHDGRSSRWLGRPKPCVERRRNASPTARRRRRIGGRTRIWTKVE